MTTSVRRRTRIVPLVALIGMLAVTPLWIPGSVVARPYLIDPGPGPTNGDPTGDDQPAPAPKPTNKAAVGPTRGSTTGRSIVRPRATVVRWRMILRTLASIALR